MEKKTGLPKKSLLLIFLIVMASVGTACSASPTATTVNMQPISVTLVSTYTPRPTPLTPKPPYEVSATPRVVFLRTQTAVVTSSPIFPSQPSAYTSLPSGQYVIYDNGHIRAVSLDGKVDKELPLRADAIAETRMSPEGHRLFYQSDGTGYLIDLQRNSLVAHFPITPLKDCQYDVLPALGYLVSVCGKDFTVEFPLEAKPAILVPGGGGLYPTWSPDGKWIAYFVFRSIPNPKPGQVELGPEDGLYLMDTSCLKVPATCTEKTRGPYRAFPLDLSWSSDAKYLTVHGAIFDMEQGQWSKELKLYDLVGETGHVVWSPDNKKLAALAEGNAQDGSGIGIYILSIADGTATKIPNCRCDGNVLAWITVP